jgi:hypothetical protein
LHHACDYVADNDAGDEPIIQCRLGKDANISEFSDVRNPDESELMMRWLTDGRCTGLSNATKKRCLAAGMRFDQEGDAEGIFVFGPGDPVQAKFAIKSVQAKAKRKMALVSLASLGKVGSNGRKHTAEGRFSGFRARIAR